MKLDGEGSYRWEAEPCCHGQDSFADELCFSRKHVVASSYLHAGRTSFRH